MTLNRTNNAKQLIEEFKSAISRPIDQREYNARLIAILEELERFTLHLEKLGDPMPPTDTDVILDEH